MHFGYQYTNGRHSVTPFGLQPLGDERFTGAAHVSVTGTGKTRSISFPEQQFDTELEARRYAEKRVDELLEAGSLAF